jgi:hypothetical protein
MITIFVFIEEACVLRVLFYSMPIKKIQISGMKFGFFGFEIMCGLSRF